VAIQQSQRRARVRPDRADQELLRSLRDVLVQRDRTAILREAATMLNRSLAPESVWIIRLDGSQRVVAQAGSNSILKRLMERAEFRQVLSTIFRHSQPLMLPDLTDRRAGESARDIPERSQGRLIICRIDGGQRPFGALTIRARPDAPFGRAEAKLVDGVAQLLSVMLKRLERESALRETMGRYRQLVDRGNDVMFQADIRTQARFTYIGPNIEGLTGYRPSDFYQNPELARQIVHPDDLPMVIADCAHLERLTGTLWLRIVGRDRRPAWVSMSRSPIYDRQGRVVAVQGSLSRITEQVVEREALRSRAEATATILQGRPFSAALRAIVRHLRYVLDAEEILVAADRTGKGSLHIVCSDGVKGSSSEDGRRTIRQDPLVRQALHAGRPVMRGSNLASIIPWSNDRTGLIVIRGLPGSATYLSEVMAAVDRFAREIATAVDFLHTDLQRVHRAIDEDRSRIARELHDGVIQTLYAAALQLQLRMDAVPDALLRTIQQTTAEIREAIQDIQQYVYDLEPSLVTLGGLAASLKQLALEFESSSGIPVTLAIEPGAAAALEPVGTDIMQIVREALSNVRRHARAGRAELTVRQAAGATVLEVRDDGTGFSPESAHGLGLRNLRTRARQLGGKIDLNSEPGKGSLVRLVLPESQPRPKMAG
jgi:signal transduction histidine kinase